MIENPGFVPDSSRPVSEAEAHNIRDRLRSLIDALAESREAHAALVKTVTDMAAELHVAKVQADRVPDIATRLNTMEVTISDWAKRIDKLEELTETLKS